MEAREAEAVKPFLKTYQAALSPGKLNVVASDAIRSATKSGKDTAPLNGNLKICKTTSPLRPVSHGCFTGLHARRIKWKLSKVWPPGVISEAGLVLGGHGRSRFHHAKLGNPEPVGMVPLPRIAEPESFAVRGKAHGRASNSEATPEHF